MVTQEGDNGAYLGASEGWYAGDVVPGESFVSSNRKFRWWAGTTDGMYYDIRTFRISYTYFVLV
jgi:hypothetical protein